jgi:hypothetical protein
MARRVPLADAMRRWKRFLLDKEGVLGPFTQHLFVIVDQQHGLHESLGGEVYLDLGLVFSHVGPLFIVGLFDRKRLKPHELTIWDRSQISGGGGTMEPITRWATPAPSSTSAKDANVTYELAMMLYRRMKLGWRKAIEARQKGRLTRIGIPPRK